MEYQRQLHLQRLAEQEAEMQARLDQQRRYAQQREQQNQVDYHRINQVNQTKVSRRNYSIFFVEDVFISSSSSCSSSNDFCWLLSISCSSFSINIIPSIFHDT